MINKTCSLLLLLLIFKMNCAKGQEGFKNKAFISTIFTVGKPDARYFGGALLSGLQGGFGWMNKKGSWHEAELNAIGIEKAEYSSGGYLGLRYQYSLMPFKKLRQASIQPLIGFGASSFIHYDVFNGHNVNFQNLYERKYLRNYSEVYISPGADIQLGKRFYTTLQIPVRLVTLDIMKEKYKHLQNSPENVYNDLQHKLLPTSRFFLRLSFGYKF